MKVICVFPFKAPESKGKPKPEVGDEDIVIDQRETWGRVYYKLQRFGDDLNYCATHFATLPDEPTEVIEEKETDYATA